MTRIQKTATFLTLATLVAGVGTLWLGDATPRKSARARASAPETVVDVPDPELREQRPIAASNASARSHTSPSPRLTVRAASAEPAASARAEAGGSTLDPSSRALANDLSGLRAWRGAAPDVDADALAFARVSAQQPTEDEVYLFGTAESANPADVTRHSR